jgi:hypothetical protein
MSVYAEQISRPFQNPPVWPPSKTTKKEPKDGADIVFSFGSAGQDVFQVSATSRADLSDDNKKEVRRTYDVVKVMNKTDPDQFVELEVLTEYQARNKIDDKRTRLRFTPQEETENIEIKKRNQVRTTAPEI